jgi:hypothetical protein
MADDKRLKQIVRMRVAGSHHCGDPDRNNKKQED